MSTDNEREIRDRLGAALGTITPPSPPVDAVLRQGRTIRTRAGAGVAAGLAAVVGLGVALPGLVAHVHAAPPVQPSYRVTVNPVRGHAEQADLLRDDQRPAVAVRRAAGTTAQSSQNGPGLASRRHGRPRPGWPAGLVRRVGSDSGADAQLLIAGRVRRGRQLPGPERTRRADHRTSPRFAGMDSAGSASCSRCSLRLRSVVAYSDRGELAYAVPFTDNTINVWLKPGQRGLARQTARIAAGVLDGKRWSFEGYAGPWGICLRTSAGNGDAAWRRTARGSGRAISSAGWAAAPRGAGSQVWNGQAAPDVSYLKFRLSDGSSAAGRCRSRWRGTGTSRWSSAGTSA